MPVEFKQNPGYKGPNSVCKRYYLSRVGISRFSPHYRKPDGTLEKLADDLSEDEAIAVCETHSAANP